MTGGDHSLTWQGPPAHIVDSVDSLVQLGRCMSIKQRFILNATRLENAQDLIVSFEAKNVQQVPPSVGDSVGSSMTTCTVGGLRKAVEEELDCLSFSGVWFSVVAQLSNVIFARNGEPQPLAFLSCQQLRDGNRPCKARVSDDGVCHSCNTVDGPVALRLALRCQFSDASGTAWLTTFHDASELVLGTSAETLLAMERSEQETFITQQYLQRWFKLNVLARPCKRYGDPQPAVAQSVAVTSATLAS